MRGKPTVFVVDDDELVRNSVSALAESMGVNAESFVSAEEFLEKHTEDRPGCLVLDLCMPGMNGQALLDSLAQRGITMPVIVLTAYARTAITVRAIKSGAVTVLDKPCDDDDLWNAIREALEKSESALKEHARRQEIRGRLAQLTPPERQVLDMTIKGVVVKAIANKLGTSERTVASRRRALLRKMQAATTADLIWLATQAEADD